MTADGVDPLELLDAAHAALQRGDAAGALRAARAAYSRSPDDGDVGLLLLHLLCRMGAIEEALAIGRRLLGVRGSGSGAGHDHAGHDHGAGHDHDGAGNDRSDHARHHHVSRPGPASGAERTAPDLLGEAGETWRALAELATDAGDVALALAALERALTWRPGDVEAAIRWSELDDDPSRSVRVLIRAAEASGIDRLRTEAFARGASVAAGELRDHALAAELYERARRAAGDSVRLLERVDQLRRTRAAPPSSPDPVVSSQGCPPPSDHADRARLLLQRAHGEQGASRAALFREASRALFAAGDEHGARAAAREAFDACPADDAAFVTALRDAASDIDRLDAVLAARARAVPGEAAGCHRARADALLAFGRPDAALSAYEACLEQAPADAGALAHVAQIRAARDGDLAADTFDRRLVALADSDPGAVPPALEAPSRWRLGLAATRERRAEEVVLHLGRALALHPDESRAPEALHALAEALAAVGDGEAALATARRLAGIASDATARRAALAFGTALATRFGDRGQDAASLLEEAAALELRAGADPSASEELAQRAVTALLRAGENARAGALAALAARIAQGPRRAAWLVRLADAAAARGDTVAARAAREEALLADPSAAGLRGVHLADLERVGDAPALARALEAALALPGADVAGLTLRLARARAAAGDDDGAERAYAALCELGPAAQGWDEAAAALAAHLERRGDLEASARLELARAEAATQPAARAVAQVAAASFLFRAGDLSRARVAAERARDAAPDLAAAWQVLARIELAAGDPRAAAHALLAAARHLRGAPAAADALAAARLLDELGAAEDSTRALLVAVGAVPRSPAARRALAERARAAGDLASAARHLAQVDREALTAEERLAHDRAVARALSEAGDPEAEPAWRELFDADASDGEAFDRVSEFLRARRQHDAWLALAARHEGALAGGSQLERRRDLRCERAALLTDLGQLDAAEGTWQAALALDPRHRRALRGLRALLEKRGDQAGAADAIAAEAAAAADPVEAAELRLDEARLRLEALRDPARAALALATALDLLRDATGDRAAHVSAHAERMRAQALALTEPSRGPVPAIDAAAATPGDAAAPRTDKTTLRFFSLARSVPPEPMAVPPTLPDPLDPVLEADPGPGGDERLRELAAAAAGPQRAAYLDRLSLRLERRGDAQGAADAALAALEADPASAERFRRSVALASGDRMRRVTAHRLRVRGAHSPPARAAALLELGGVLAASPESLPEAAEVLERACALQPASGAAAAALAEVLLALGNADRALAVLTPFEGGAPDLSVADAGRLLVAAAQATGDPHLVLEKAERAADRSPRDPTALAALATALVEAGREREAIAVEERALAFEPPGPHRTERQAALAARAEAAGDRDRALWLYQGVRASRPDDLAILGALCRLHAAAGDTVQLAALARDLERAGGGEALGPLAAAAGQALLRSGDPAAALPHLQRAHAAAPHDEAVLRDLASAAERAGDVAATVRAGEALAKLEATTAPAAAAARLRRLAELATERLGDEERARELRSRATALSPAGDDAAAPDLPLQPREAPRSIDAALARARGTLFDAAAVGELAGVARLLATGTPGPQVPRLLVLARAAAGLASFAAGTATRTSGAPALPVSRAARERVSQPVARSAPARLLALLAPWLEPLFPADLGRRGVGGAHRLSAQRGPELLALVDETQRALATRSCAVFLADTGGCEIAAENTRPPSIVLGAGVGGPISAAERRFVVARALALLDLGWALAGKFAPQDVAIVCEVACRFAGSTPPSPRLPLDRARPFLDALERVAPATAREQAAALAPQAALELAALDAHQLTAALRQTASRIALLHTGQSGAALSALAASDPRLARAPRSRVVEDADVRDLAAFALSEAYLELRVTAETTP